MKKTLLMAAILVLSASMAYAQLGTATVNTTLSLAVAPEAALTIQTATTTFSTPSLFTNYTAGTNFTYFVRTKKVLGSGTITVKIAADWSPAGGPSVASPPDAADLLTYSCTVPNPGKGGTTTQCTGPITAALTDTNVATFSTDARTDRSGVASSVAWTLVNDPQYQTGSYTATATFTISAV